MLTRLVRRACNNGQFRDDLTHTWCSKWAFLPCFWKAQQELRLLSSVTLYCQVTMIVMFCVLCIPQSSISALQLLHTTKHTSNKWNSAQLINLHILSVVRQSQNYDRISKKSNCEGGHFATSTTLSPTARHTLLFVTDNFENVQNLNILLEV